MERVDRSKRAGIQERMERVRVLLLEGKTQIKIMKEARVSNRVVTKVRLSLGSAVLCGCGKPVTHGGGCESKRGDGEQRIRALLLEGKSPREAMAATGSGPDKVDRVRRSLGELRCPCGKPSSHSGVCEYRRSLRRERTRDLPANLVDRRERFAAFMQSPCNTSGISEHVGAVGFRLFNLQLRVVAIHKGERFIAKMVDAEGNVFVWSANLKRCIEAGGEYVIDGTVKSHDEWGGQKQTVLSRCSFPSSTTASPGINAPEVVASDPDLPLLERMHGGDTEALRSFIEQHRAAVFVTAYRILWDHAEVEDIVQMVFSRLWNLAVAGRCRADGNAVAFVCRMARNFALEELKRRGRFVSYDDEWRMEA